MKYINPFHKKGRNTHFLQVSCGHCRTPVLVYEKGGKGNLIKLQSHRIVQGSFNLKDHRGHLYCPHCKEKLANRGVYKGRLTYFVQRGNIHTRRLDHYTYP